VKLSQKKRVAGDKIPHKKDQGLFVDMDSERPQADPALGTLNDQKEWSVTTNSFAGGTAKKGEGHSREGQRGEAGAESRYFRPYPTGPMSLTVKKGNQVIV